ncbi:5-methyltetrahydropteroyltriglutamate--homocysteine methyltransferase [Syncephalis fuscata]|nr:5-methyltetrahydropteroyltriglutamate--homocysteine methyltransferase [Syncephalis fuscata]
MAVNTNRKVETDVQECAFALSYFIVSYGSCDNLGFPRIGANRELKRLVEGYWSGKVDEATLLGKSHEIRETHWGIQKSKGLHHVTVGDFSLYDHVLDTSVTLGVIPERYQHLAPGLQTYFAMARGLQKPASSDGAVAAVDVPAMEMKKWFDTNYHYIVPELSSHQAFKLAIEPKVVSEFKEASKLGISARPVIIGPISYLLLSKPGRDVANATNFNRFALLPDLIAVYIQLLQQLADAGATWIQVDEPFLALDLPTGAREHFVSAYTQFAEAIRRTSLKLLLTTYFARIPEQNISLIGELPVQGIHVDLVRAPEQLDAVLSHLRSEQVISLGLVDGRNVWRTNLRKALALAQHAINHLAGDKSRVFIGPSSSLLHSPHTFANESDIDKEIIVWLAGATEKLDEIAVLTKAINDGEESVQSELKANDEISNARRTSTRIHKPEVRKRLDAVSPDQLRRRSPFATRRTEQNSKLQLPRFPTTTVGSFPQTNEVRLARSRLRKQEWTQDQYNQFIREEIERAVRFQERVGLDMLVHGESERNDMVEYFGEQLDGYVFTKFGWVSSYGTRCVKPPIIYGDIQRLRPMTVDIIRYAQSLTSRPLKGMLTGPITCLQWSFVRDDQPRRDTAFQLALAIRDEVTDLEAAGVPAVQIDEPAIREGLPLHRADWEAYLQCTGVADNTQIHTHMCYSDFNDIFPAIQRLDADVITIENSPFDRYSYTNEIGPVPSVDEMHERAVALLRYLPADLLWINPDCGLKTRALTNLVTVARKLRAESS